MPNRRSRMTITIVKKAFLELLRDQPIEKITILGLCKKADINRSTFYAHYEDITSLANEIKDEYISSHLGFLRLINSEGMDEMLEYLRYQREHNEEFLLLSTNTTFVNDITEIYTASLRAVFVRDFGEMDKDFETYFNGEADFLFYGMAYLIGRWLKEDCPYNEELIVSSMKAKLQSSYAYVREKQLEFLENKKNN